MQDVIEDLKVSRRINRNAVVLRVIMRPSQNVGTRERIRTFTQEGLFATSPPFGRFVRIECNQGSSFPVQLEQAGHRLHHAGMTTRVDGGAFHTVDVLELDLSGR